MHLVMCTSCGEFVEAFPGSESLEPSKDECPKCGGTEFKDTESGRYVGQD